MLSRLWGWIVAAFAIMGAGLLFVIGQRDRARETAEAAKAKAAGEGNARKLESNIDQARNEARQNTADTINEHQARPDGERPVGRWRTK